MSQTKRVLSGLVAGIVVASCWQAAPLAAGRHIVEPFGAVAQRVADDQVPLVPRW
jgi:hypothetical protein